MSEAKHRLGKRKRVPYAGRHRIAAPKSCPSAFATAIRRRGIQAGIAFPLALALVLYPSALGDGSGRSRIGDIIEEIITPPADAEEVIIDPGTPPDD